MVFVAFVVFVGLGWPGLRLYGPDSNWPDQEFVDLVGQGPKFVGFSLGFVAFVSFVEFSGLLVWITSVESNPPAS